MKQKKIASFPYQSVGSATLTLIGYVGNVSEHDREGNGEDSAYGNHGKIPPRVDVNEGNWSARKKDSDQEEEFSAPYVRQCADQWRAQEWQQSL